MRRTAVLVLAMFVCAAAWAQKPVDQKDSQQGAPKENKPAHMQSMHMDMMKHFASAQMAASPDGGVIVLKGDQLLKYDKDLNLTKQVELPRDSFKKGMFMGADKEHRDKPGCDSQGSEASGPAAAPSAPSASQKK